MTKAEPPARPTDSGLCLPAFLSLPDHGKGLVSAAFVWARSPPPLSGLDKGGPFTASRAEGAIQCLDNSTTKSMWPFRLHQLDSAPPPSGLTGLSGEKIPTGPRGQREFWTNRDLASTPAVLTLRRGLGSSLLLPALMA